MEKDNLTDLVIVIKKYTKRMVYLVYIEALEFLLPVYLSIELYILESLIQQKKLLNH